MVPLEGMPKISLIILTYNSSRYISDLLTGLMNRFDKELVNKALEILVADNASQDETVKLAKKFKKIQVIENGGNYGFAKGNNLAVKKATGEYLLFINPDAKFIDGDIFELLKSFKDEKVGIVGGEIMNWQKEKELSCGKFYKFFSTTLLTLGLEEFFRVRFSPEKEQFVDFVSGGFLMIRREVFEKLNGFDENYFMYIEDSDLCFRAKKIGYKTKFSPKATIQHMGQGSSNRTFAIINIYKGLVYFNKKHSNYLEYLFVRFALKTKALLLVILGKIMNNRYLVDTYSVAMKL